MEIVIAGKNRLAVEGLSLALKYFDAAQVSVVLGKISDVDKRYFPGLEEAASKSGVSILQIEDVYPMADAVFLSLEYDKVVKPALFSTKKLYNLHLSLLPEFRGVATSAWPIIKGRESAGSTLHKIDDGIDTGDILGQASFRIPSDETSFGLHNKLLDSGHQLLSASFAGLISNTLVPRPQLGIGSYFRRTDLIFSEVNLANFTNCGDLHRWFRALYFPIYQLPRFHDHKISSVEVLEPTKSAPHGAWWWSEGRKFISVSLRDGMARLRIASPEN
jgi:methionyl-tRNA formyltransferase